MDSHQPRPTSSLRRFLLWSLGGGCLGVIATLVVLAILHRDPTPGLTQAIFDAAHERWSGSAPANYDIETRVTGPQPATYRVQVRGGQALAAWRNAAPLTNAKTFGTWSVPGMFGTISRDLESEEQRTDGRARPGTPQLILKAEFDPQYNYPQRYRRIEWGSRRGSNAVTVTWEVVEFRVVE
jgi:hypothetical protein